MYAGHTRLKCCQSTHRLFRTRAVIDWFPGPVAWMKKWLMCVGLWVVGAWKHGLHLPVATPGSILMAVPSMEESESLYSVSAFAYI